MSIDKTSSAWKGLEKYILDRIAVLQKQLEDEDLDLAQTQFIRGRIAELRLLTKVDEPSKFTG